jgi:hypothetical protein
MADKHEDKLRLTPRMFGLPVPMLQVTDPLCDSARDGNTHRWMELAMGYWGWHKELGDELRAMERQRSRSAPHTAPFYQIDQGKAFRLSDSRDVFVRLSFEEHQREQAQNALRLRDGKVTQIEIRQTVVRVTLHWLDA